MNKILPVLLMAPAFLAAQSGDCGKAFEASFAAGQKLELDLRAGEVDIQGTDKPGIRVTCEVRHDAEQVKISLSGSRLTVDHGPSRDVHYRIELPAETGLYLRMTAGEVRVLGMIGDKDLGLRAGSMHVEVGKASQYRKVNASVSTGDLDARAFGEHKSGLFRSLERTNAEGKYDLRVKVATGEMELR